MSVYPFIFVRAAGRYVRINFEDVRYIEADKNYVKIYTTRETITTQATLKQLAAALPPNRFMQIHRSYLVSLAHVTGFDRRVVYLSDGQLPIGEAYYGEFLRQVPVLGGRE